jgi:hypothetical protein
MYPGGVGKPLQVRDVPDDVLDALRHKAEMAGMSLSSYALEVLTRDASYPPIPEVLAEIGTRLHRQGGPKLGAEGIAELVREDRGPLGRQQQ